MTLLKIVLFAMALPPWGWILPAPLNTWGLAVQLVGVILLISFHKRFI